MMADDQKDSNRTTRVAKALEASQCYRAMDADLWFQPGSVQPGHTNSEDAESATDIQERRLAQIHYTYACKAYDACLELCLEQLESEDKSSRKALILETALLCCKCDSGIPHSRLAYLLDLSKAHWRNAISLGLTAASLMLKMGDPEAALLATVPAIMHCGDVRIGDIISQAIARTPEPTRLAQKFVDRLIEENLTPELVTNRLRAACSYHSQQPVTWESIVAGLASAGKPDSFTAFKKVSTPYLETSSPTHAANPP